MAVLVGDACWLNLFSAFEHGTWRVPPFLVCSKLPFEVTSTSGLKSRGEKVTRFHGFSRLLNFEKCYSI